MRRRILIGQNFPNYQEQLAGPPAGQGLTPPRRGEKTRMSITAPMSINNQVLPQQHVFSVREEPSGSGPGGQELNTPNPRMGLLSRIVLLLCPPKAEIRLPQGDWLSVLSNSASAAERNTEMYP